MLRLSYSFKASYWLLYGTLFFESFFLSFEVNGQKRMSLVFLDTAANTEFLWVMQRKYIAETLQKKEVNALHLTHYPMTQSLTKNFLEKADRLFISETLASNPILPSIYLPDADKFSLKRKFLPPFSIDSLENTYVDYVLGQSFYYDSLGNALFGRSVPHVLCLPVNELNAAFISTIIDSLKSQGWEFETWERANKDPVYYLAHWEARDEGASVLDWWNGQLEGVKASSFFEKSHIVELRTKELLVKLSDEQKAAQMIVAAAGRLGKPTSTVRQLVKEAQIGGILLLNGTIAEFKNLKEVFDKEAVKAGSLPLLYSADAEPSLINRKIPDSPPVLKANQIKDTVQAIQAAYRIDSVLLDIGVYHNYSPVADVSPDNEAIGNRSFGTNSDSVAWLADAYIQATQNDGLAATAKHFPGHGFVQGDSHAMLPVIKGAMKELPVFQKLIDNGVVSIMVGHIAVEDSPYATDGLPASCSKKIVTDLLKKKMGFEGLVVTDALGMGGVRSIPNNAVKAAKAGCDLLLMPVDEKEAVTALVDEMKNDVAFEQRVNEAVGKLLRLKIMLGLLDAVPTGLRSGNE